MIKEGSRAQCKGRVLKKGMKTETQSFKWLNLLFKSSLGLISGAKDAWIKEKNAGNGLLYLRARPIKHKTRVDQSVIYLLPFLVFPLNRK